MFSVQCNIEQSDRTNRIVIGVILILAALLNLGWLFYAFVGVVLVVEGAIGWCAIPHIIDKIKSKNT